MNIIITGASKGIGFEIARKFLSESHHVIIAIARSQDKLQQLKNYENKSSSSSVLHILPFDLVSGDLKKDLLPSILGQVDKIDILINNAGSLVKKNFEELNMNDFDHMFNSNVKSAFSLSQVLVTYLNKGSHILNISSMGGFQGSVKFPGLSLYSASKAALAVLTECLAEELKEKNIKTNCLCIGAAETEMLKKAFPGYKAPLTAEEISHFICDFALTGHHYMNGKILPVSLSTP